MLEQGLYCSTECTRGIHRLSWCTAKWGKSGWSYLLAVAGCFRWKKGR